MPVRQIYRFLFLAPLLVAVATIAPVFLLAPSLCGESEAAFGCAWQVTLAETLSRLLGDFVGTVDKPYAEVAFYCAVAAIAAHFAFPDRFFRRALSALRVAPVLGFSVVAIVSAANAVTKWLACTVDPDANFICTGTASGVALYYSAATAWLVVSIFLPIGLAVSVAHGIVLGVIYGARDERSTS